MLIFGVLKFVVPFKTWYTLQIEQVGLGAISYWTGIAGEITVGIGFLFVLAFFKKMSPVHSRVIITLLSLIVIVMMTVSIYVHLHPHVSADVLPLKIKPPYIPGFFLIMAIINIVRSYKFLKYDSKENDS